MASVPVSQSGVFLLCLLVRVGVLLLCLLVRDKGVASVPVSLGQGCDLCPM